MKYKKNYIENFIFKINFKESNQEIVDAILNSLKQNLADTFNGLKSREIINNMIEMNEDTNIAQITSTQKVIEYRLFNKNEDEFITITNEYIAYETTKYQNFEAANSIIKKMIKNFKDSSNIETCTRIGMRFINDIILPSETKNDIYNWKGYIQNPLLNDIEFFREKNQKEIIQSMHSIDIESNEDKNIYYTIQYGLYNSRRPSQMLDKQYIIDIDAHTKTVEDIEDVESKIKIMHKEIEELFETIIDDEMRKNMEVCNDN